MSVYRDDNWPPGLPRDPEAADIPAQPPDVPAPEPDEPDEPGEPDVPDYPSGGGAGGDLDDGDYPEEPDEGPYTDPEDTRRDDEYRIAQRGNRCIQARHELASARDQIAADERAIEYEREKIAENRRELVGCASGRGRYYVLDSRGRLQEASCEDFFRARIQRSERAIAMRQNRIHNLRSQLPVLEKRAREACAGT